MPLQPYVDKYSVPKYTGKTPKYSGKTTTSPDGPKAGKTQGRKKTGKTNARKPVSHVPAYLSPGVTQPYQPNANTDFGARGAANQGFDPSQPWLSQGMTEEQYKLQQGFMQNIGISPTNEDLMASYWQWKQNQYHQNGSDGLTYDFGDPMGPPAPSKPGLGPKEGGVTGDGVSYYPYQPSGGGAYTYPSYGPSSSGSFQPRDNKRGWVQKVLNWRINE